MATMTLQSQKSHRNLAFGFGKNHGSTSLNHHHGIKGRKGTIESNTKPIT